MHGIHGELSLGFKDIILFQQQQQQPSELLIKTAREWIDYSIVNGDITRTNSAYVSKYEKFVSFMHLVRDYVIDLYKRYSYSVLNLPYQAAQIVMILSIAGILQKDMRNLDGQCNRGNKAAATRVKHCYFCISVLFSAATELYYSHFKSPKGESTEYKRDLFIKKRC